MLHEHCLLISTQESRSAHALGATLAEIIEHLISWKYCLLSYITFLITQCTDVQNLNNEQRSSMDFFYHRTLIHPNLCLTSFFKTLLV